MTGVGAGIVEVTAGAVAVAGGTAVGDGPGAEAVAVGEGGRLEGVAVGDDTVREGVAVGGEVQAASSRINTVQGPRRRMNFSPSEASDVPRVCSPAGRSARSRPSLFRVSGTFRL